MTTNHMTMLEEVTPSDALTALEAWDACLMDPPWRLQGGEKHYETLSMAQLSELRPALDALLKPNAWLYVWTTKGLIEDTKRLITALGFTFHDFLVWTKPNRYGYGDPRIGIRRATEYLLVASRGAVRSHYRAQQDFFSQKAGIHAEKPLIQHQIIRRMVGPDARVLELFARTHYDDPRWGAWGMELEHCDVSLLPWGWPVPADFLPPRSTSAASTIASPSDEQPKE